MPAKKRKRPLRKSYAGVLAGLPPAIAAQFTDAARAASLERALLDEQSISKGFLAKIQEDAKVISELTEALRMKDLVLSNLEGNIRELAAESEWWRGQAADYQSELLAYVRDEARRAKPVVEES